MSAHTGEEAREGGEFRCAKCYEKVRVNKGERIPKCPNCGSNEFSTREHETSGSSAGR